ncbi:trans-sulfuration enzyme family protein [Intrasporangium calvum]|uniref:Cys/Met metabolism pyridoxal-phosphate-dependent protein n=1 Tax=Intrasporangium calvum (strain ATCC 23552 / DSM 43043 / JCM 3097 / NBRC 12989 / NCIMB 10167 / NRRL B-3866 / 7 KIP) TaxID=710696 RepID=E6SF44_INTC7|nr:PLP-dependent transferase [Intrasporangium calvum]ADU48833.1 Cys/Met metabolism pyridoxal-phosphate-dependent protein [Intrasporangium calvum DSM 43043]AXG13814.1 cystathionine gamma-synthase [Intrasporangium calvum]
MSETPELHVDTILVSAGRPAAEPGAAVNPPVVLSSTFVADGPVNYARVGNPTWHAFEEAVGRLEGGRALVHASGMGAISAALSVVPAGGTVVVPDTTYNGTGDLLRAFEEAGGRVRRLPATDTAGFVAALDGAALVWLESPTNPLMEVIDLTTVLGAARARGVVSVVDNTLPTPLGCQPLRLGADVVVHSATKYLAGHSDVLLGVTVTADDERGRGLGERLHRARTLGGAIAGPMEVYLGLRGLRTLALRLERASANAAELARRLHGHPAVERVRFPGSGAMLSIDVVGGAEAAERVCAATRVWVHSTSLGGVESQLERRRRHPSEAATVPANLVRLSVGIEHVEDLWADLDRALGAAL